MYVCVCVCVCVYIYIYIYELLLRDYRPFWTLVSNKTLLHSFRFLTTLCPFLFTLLSNLQSRDSIFFVIFPFFLFLPFCQTLLFCILSLFILSICIYHRNLSDIINFTMSAPCTISYISLYFIISQVPSSSVGPKIFLTTCLSNGLRIFIFSLVFPNNNLEL